MPNTSDNEITTLLASLLDENQADDKDRLRRYVVNFLKALKESKSKFSLSKAQADSLLQLTYESYHGRNLDSNDRGRDYFAPIIEEAGFLGMLLVIGDILRLKQDETDRRVEKTLNKLAGELSNPSLQRDPYCNLVVRFFGERGVEWIKELSKEAPKVDQLRSQARALLDGNNSDSDLNKALDLLNEAIQIPWPSYQVWHNHGLALFRLGCYDKAILSYHRSINLNNADKSLLYWSCEGLKKCYEKSGNQEAGWKYFEALSRERSEQWIVWHERGYMAGKTNRVDEAIASYTKAIELHHSDPTWVQSSQDLVGCLDKYGDLEKGFKAFSELTRKIPDYWILWHDKGRLEWKLKRPNDAVESYRKAIKVHGKGWFWSWQDLGDIYYEDLQDYSNAAKAYAKAQKRGEIEKNEHAGKAQSGLINALKKDTWQLRELLKEAFTEPDLKYLIFDRFPEVYNRFSDSTGKDEKIHTLLEYCIRQDQLKKLLNLVETLNPAKYSQFLGLNEG